MPFKFKIHDYQDPSNPGQSINIGGPGLNADYVSAMIDSAGGQDCTFEISSVGGDLKAGLDMFDAIKAYGKADTRIGAMAASSAGIVAMAGRNVTMSKYGLLMLHKPMTSAAGNSDDIQASIDLLNIMQSRIAQIYMDKSGLDEKTINKLINSVTWLTADQALSLGFIDAIEDCSAEVLNHALVSQYAATAPEVYQRVFNKLQIENPTESMKIEDAELIKKNESMLTRIFNFFKSVTNKTSTDKGVLNHIGVLAVGTKVTNEEGDDAEEGDYEFENAAGKKVKMSVKDSAVLNIEGDKAEEAAESASEEEKEQKAATNVLNGLNLKVTNSVEAVGIAKVITNHVGQISDLTKKLEEVTNQLKVSNEAVSRDEAKIKADIKSEFTPDGSKRSDKGVTNTGVEFKPVTNAAQNAVAMAMAKAKIK